MEVTKTTFNWHLPRMLNDLSKCSCVALDMEFSGISGRSSNASAKGNTGNGNPRIQDRYLEVKAAADTYQILQIGLTFVEEDVDNGRYILRPYNLHLSPVLDSKLDIDRSWSYQSSAVDFLMSNGFRMDAPFTEGINYISRDEEEQAKQRSRDRETRMANISEIDVESLDEDAIAFLSRVRREINESINSGEFKRDGYINISRAKEATADDKFSLNSYQKRLVHQLVRAEYSDLVSVGKRTFVQIVPHNAERERGVQESRLKALGDRIARQTGLRWIIEALIGGDLSKIDPWCFASVIDDPSGVDITSVTNYSHRLQEKLKSKRPPTLVGHNIFVDLVYLYRTFIGSLPDCVEEFQRKIHALFPLIVDTKYMETYNCGSSKASSSLEEVNSRLAARTQPTIVTDSQHSRYSNGAALHEAGYDSLITAQILLRLSVEIHEEFLQNGPPFEMIDGNSPQPWNSDIEQKIGDLIDVDDKGAINSLRFLDTVLKSTKASTTVSSSPSESLPQQGPVDWTQPAEVSRIRSMFAHATKFDLLTDQTEDEVIVTSSLVKYNPLHDPEEPLLDFPEELAIKEKVDKGELIPRFEDKFWRVYGNKLRVFGTAEEVMDLGGLENGVSMRY